MRPRQILLLDHPKRPHPCSQTVSRRDCLTVLDATYRMQYNSTTKMSPKPTPLAHFPEGQKVHQTSDRKVRSATDGVGRVQNPTPPNHPPRRTTSVVHPTTKTLRTACKALGKHAKQSSLEAVQHQTEAAGTGNPRSGLSPQLSCSTQLQGAGPETWDNLGVTAPPCPTPRRARAPLVFSARDGRCCGLYFPRIAGAGQAQGVHRNMQIHCTPEETGATKQVGQRHMPSRRED